MNKMIKFVFVFFLFPSFVFAQDKLENYKIKNPKEKKEKKCKSYLEVYKTIPQEFRHGISIEDGNIIINFTHKDYFDFIFNKKWDGIMVEIVTSDQFGCNVNYESGEELRGYLLPPIYKKEMLKNKIERMNGYFSFRYGKFPESFTSLDTELNLLTIQKKYWCDYTQFISLGDNLWKLLEMGFYHDTISKSTIIRNYEEVVKKIRFTIPFEKGKTEFNEESIKPLYDSLSLTDFNIKKIRIRAYSSIEGDEKKNIELQNGRAKSIIDALQVYQIPKIKSEVIVSENWNGFRRDIKGTKYEYLIDLPKDKVREVVGKHPLKKELEPILKNHRKVEIELSLQKRLVYDESEEGIRTFFNRKIKERNLEEALYLQQIIFEKIMKNELPENFIGTLEVPEISYFGSLYNNFAIFGFSFNETDKVLHEQISVFKRLSELFPDNAKINYNLTTLKLKSWKYGENETNKDDLLESIKRLENLGIEKILIRRLTINYNIILSYYLFKNQEFKKKDRVMNEVFRNYKQLELNDTQLLIIAKYFASYSNYHLANAVLEKRVLEKGVNNDLIFYFLELNLNGRKKKIVQMAWLKALELDHERVCNLFLSIPKGGISFQLREKNFLDTIYCEHCND